MSSPNPSQAAVLLPQDLDRSLALLSDAELLRLIIAVRRAALERGLPCADQTEPTPARDVRTGARRSISDVPEIAASKANLIRAAIKAGVKPSAVSRQFGVSSAVISKALRTI